MRRLMVINYDESSDRLVYEILIKSIKFFDKFTF